MRIGGIFLFFLAIVILCGSIIINSLRIGDNHGKISRLETQIACLEHPHAESSIAGVFKNGKFIITQPAHKTGC